MKLLTILLIPLLSGCVASYQHFSDPRVANDGYDLMCLGAEITRYQITARIDACQGIGPYSEQMMHTSLEWRPHIRQK